MPTLPRSLSSCFALLQPILAKTPRIFQNGRSVRIPVHGQPVSIDLSMWCCIDAEQSLFSLLDMQVTNGEELLEKYGLKANDAVLAEGKQKEM